MHCIEDPIAHRRRILAIAHVKLAPQRRLLQFPAARQQHCQSYLHSIQHGFPLHESSNHPTLGALLDAWKLCHRPRCAAGGRSRPPVEFLGMNCVICALLIMSRGVAWRCFLPDRMRRLSTQHKLLELPSSRAGRRLIADDNKHPMRIKLCHESSFHCCRCTHLLTVC